MHGIHFDRYMKELRDKTIPTPAILSKYTYIYSIKPSSTTNTFTSPFFHSTSMLNHQLSSGNRAHPTSGDVMFASDDPRRVLTLPADHRIHSVLNCGAASCPPLDSYFASDLDQTLDTSMANLCRDGVTSINKSTIIINSIFEWFRSDFGATEQDALRFLATCADDPARSAALNAAADGKRRYTYYYDWSLNNM